MSQAVSRGFCSDERVPLKKTYRNTRPIVRAVGLAHRHGTPHLTPRRHAPRHTLRQDAPSSCGHAHSGYHLLPLAPHPSPTMTVTHCILPLYHTPVPVGVGAVQENSRMCALDVILRNGAATRLALEAPKRGPPEPAGGGPCARDARVSGLDGTAQPATPRSTACCTRILQSYVLF